jgi:hypothetical protein
MRALNGPHGAFFASSFRVEVEPLPSPLGPFVFLSSFLSSIQRFNICLASWPPWDPLGLCMAHFLDPRGPRGPWGLGLRAKGPQDPFTLILFSSFIPFSMTQTAPSFAFTTLSCPFLSGTLLGAPLGPLGTLPAPPLPWASQGPGPRHNCDPCDHLTLALRPRVGHLKGISL